MGNRARDQQWLLPMVLAVIAAACSAANAPGLSSTESGTSSGGATGTSQPTTTSSSSGGSSAAVMTAGSSSETLMTTGGATTGASGGGASTGGAGTTPITMLPSSTAGTAATQDGPCATPPLRIDVVVDTDFDICVTEPPLQGNFPFHVKMSCDGEPCPSGSAFPVDRDSGYSFDWDAQFVDVGQPACTNGSGVDDSCTTPLPVSLCAFDDPDASAYLGTNADGQTTMTSFARLVTSRGTCSNDLLMAQIVVEPNQGSVVTIRSSDYVLPTSPETFECAGVTCSGATEYCRAEYVVGENGATLVNGSCVPYPSECENDHTCDCVLPVRPDGVGCADNGLRGTTQVLDHP